MFPTGLEGQGVVRLSFPDADGADDIIDDGGEGDDIDAFVQLFNDMGMDQIHDGLVDDDQSGHEDKGAFYRGGEEFGLAMSIGMVFVSGFWRQRTDYRAR